MYCTRWVQTGKKTNVFILIQKFVNPSMRRAYVFDGRSLGVAFCFLLLWIINAGLKKRNKINDVPSPGKPSDDRKGDVELWESPLKIDVLYIICRNFHFEKCKNGSCCRKTSNADDTDTKQMLNDDTNYERHFVPVSSECRTQIGKICSDSPFAFESAPTNRRNKIEHC